MTAYCIDDPLQDESLHIICGMSDQTRIQMQTSYVQNGLRTRNEIRRDDGLKRLEGADELTAQNNLYPISQLGQADATQTPQTPLTTQPQKQ